LSVCLNLGLFGDQPGRSVT